MLYCLPSPSRSRWTKIEHTVFNNYKAQGLTDVNTDALEDKLRGVQGVHRGRLAKE